MVNLSVEVRGEYGAFTVPVQATSIRRAEEFVASRFPGREVRVIFPIDGEGFFLDEGASKSSGRRHRWLTKRGVQAISGVEADPSKTGAGSRVYATPR